MSFVFMMLVSGMAEAGGAASACFAFGLGIGADWLAGLERRLCADFSRLGFIEAVDLCFLRLAFDGLDDALGGIVVDALEMLDADAHAKAHEIGRGHLCPQSCGIDGGLKLWAHANADRSFWQCGVWTASHGRTFHVE